MARGEAEDTTTQGVIEEEGAINRITTLIGVIEAIEVWGIQTVQEEELIKKKEATTK